ncbi:MAG: hypothetical protein E7331_10210 [Clostridiales bacterium]|nr:hypothetical protein [Clostridiales bacterium]
MNHQQEKQEHVSFRAALKKAPGRLWNTIKHNWGWKLLALFLAICLWTGLINQDPTLTRRKVFNNITLSVTGESTLQGNGLIVLSGLEEENLVVDLEAEVPQRNYSTSHYSNFTPRVDVSRITGTGEQTLRIQTTSSTTYGTVESVFPESITVIVDEYVTNYRVPVTVRQSGSDPAGFYGPAPELNPSTVAISGPKSVVDTIASVTVDYDRSSLLAQEGRQRFALPMHVINTDGEEIPQNNLRISSANIVLRSITLDQTLYPTKKMDVSTLINLTGQPAKGYEVKSVTASPTSLIAAGDTAALETINTLFTSSPVDVSGKDASFAVDLTLRKPGTLTYLSTDTVKVEVEIGPVMITRTFDGLKPVLRNVPAGCNAALNLKNVSVTVTGPENTLTSMKPAFLLVYADLAGYQEGVFTLPLTVEFNNTDLQYITYVVEPVETEVTITAK